MANTNLNNSVFNTDNSVKSEHLQAINTAINTTDTELQAISAKQNRVSVFNFQVDGFIDNYAAAEIDSFGTHEAQLAFNLTNFTLTILDNSDSRRTSSAGTLEVKMELFNSSTQQWDTITSVNPSIGVGVSARGSTSNNATFSTASITTGQKLRIKPVSFKDTQGSFLINAYGEAT
ncbi:hypothetical protein [uncultured Mediterranean phage uvMED]|nr:hypothetical protein [uncultured Mediterranean phage uvMED]